MISSRVIYGLGFAALVVLVLLVAHNMRAKAAIAASVPASSAQVLAGASGTDAVSVQPSGTALADAGSTALLATAVAAATPAASSAATTTPSSPAAATGAARNLAGTVSVADGSALQYGPDRVGHKVSVGDKIYEGDALVTMADAEVHMDMADGGYIAIRPNTTLRLTLYQANGDSSDKSVIGLLKGSFRSITGWIGKSYPANYAINTPTATIGVRGTDHEPAYIPEGTPGQDAGTYDNVHEGGTTISNEAGHIDVAPDHAGFVDPHKNVAPRVLDRVPAFLQVQHRHDQLFVGKHAEVMANLEKMRTERVRQHVEEIRNGTAVRAGPTSLREKMIQNHAAESLAVQHRAVTGGNAAAEEAARRAGQTPGLESRRPTLERKPLGAPNERTLTRPGESQLRPGAPGVTPRPVPGAAPGTAPGAAPGGGAAAALDALRQRAAEARAKAPAPAAPPVARPALPDKKRDDQKKTP